MKRFFKKKVIPSIVLSLTVLLVSCQANNGDDTSNNDSENNVAVYPVEIEIVSKGILTDDLMLTGTVMAKKIVPVIPMLAGEVTAVHVSEGDLVEAGDLLLEIDGSDVELSIAQAQAGLKAAEAGLKSAKSMQDQSVKQAEMQVEQAENAVQMMESARVEDALSFDNIPEELHGIFERLMTSNMPTAQDKAQAEMVLEQAKFALEQTKNAGQTSAAEASVEQAKIGVKMAEKQKGNTKVTAPISGIVTNFSKIKGEFISPQLPLLQMIQMDEPIVSLSVNETMLGSFAEEQAVEVSIPSLNKTFAGVVTRIGFMPNEQSRSYPVDITISTDDDDRLRIGMVAELLLQTKLTEEKVILPVQAVFTEDEESFVYVTSNGETVEKRVVSIGYETSDEFEVISGLKEGEYIVINGQHQLHDGAHINMTNEEEINF